MSGRRLIVPKHQSFVGVLVDLDGTLIRSEARFRLAFRDVCAELGLDFDRIDYRKCIGHSGMTVCRELIRQFGRSDDPAAWYRRFNDILYERHFQNVEWMPGADAFLDDMAR
jgi:beta-phosphoglucomutase-like phosphatase (HAD superfamily)